MKKILLSICVAMMCVVLGGCSKNEKGENENYGASVAVIFSNVADFPALNENTVYSLYEDLSGYCLAGLKNGGNITVISNQSEPVILVDEKIKEITTNITESKFQSKAEALAKSVIRVGAQERAKTPEVNPLDSLNLAAKAVKSNAKENERVIIFYFNGKQTAGILDMSESDILSINPKSIAKELVDKRLIEDLTGITVKCIGMGQTANGCQKIPQSYAYKMEELWGAIIEEAGGTVEFSAEPIYGEALDNNLPEVTEIIFVEDELESLSKIPDVMRLDQDSIMFHADSAEFADEKAVNNILRKLADYYVQNKSEKLYIFGSTATVGDIYKGILLSYERGVACAQLLEAMGVSREQLVVGGLGHIQHSLRVNDTDERGQLIEENAAINRAVYFVSEDSPFVEEAMGIWEKNKMY